ncbi:MAG: hypothetical protein R3B09_04780 [Nannocystaceae bacterium]
MKTHRSLPLSASAALSLALALIVVGCAGASNDDDTAADASTTEDSASGSTSGESTSDASTDASTDASAGTGGESDGSSSTSGTSSDTDTDTGIPSEPFSFFVTSLESLQLLSGSQEGFGGDLRYGEEGPGAGLRGADKICGEIAEMSMPGASKKEWRAFLSAVSGEDGQQVDAIDRVGEGPWYDRLGRLVADNKANLIDDRPVGMDTAIVDDFPNEWGVPNHQPDPNQPEVDNHDMLTGTNDQGELYSATATCLDWTSNLGDLGSEGKPRVGHSWPRYMMGGGGGGGGMGPGMMGDVNSANWMSALTESGCAPGVSLIEMGPPQEDSVTVGSGGGYGGFYCFALNP